MYSKRVRNIYKKIDAVDSTAGKFALSIAIYSSNLINAMNILDDADAGFRKGKMLYQHNLMYMRMLIDCCLEVFTALIVTNKENYFNHFLEGKPTNQIKKSGKALTKSYLLSEIEKEFEGVEAIYKECCCWIHPSKTTVVRVAKYRKSKEEYIGYRGKAYTKMRKEKEDILKDFDYCVDILLELLTRLKDYYYKKDKGLVDSTDVES